MRTAHNIVDAAAAKAAFSWLRFMRRQDRQRLTAQGVWATSRAIAGFQVNREHGRMSDCKKPLRRTLRIVNARGLHARASARFVKCAEGFDAEITVSRDGMSVSGTSIMGLMMLAAACGSEIEVEAKGPQAREALDALEALVNNRFDEEE